MTNVSTLSIIHSFHGDLKKVKALVYDRCGLHLTDPRVNTESVEYGACSFRLNGKIIQHRVSKITPTKAGQFVAIWKRNVDGITEPFDTSDALDYIIITSKSGDDLGQFVFPKSVLADKGIITSKGKSGKRGIRVYPPWDIAPNKQAESTQIWQTKYFFTIKSDLASDLNLAKKLLT
jgi:hypothetical protein